MHKFLVNKKWFRMYWRGGYCLLEIDFGRAGRNERTIQLFTRNGIFNTFVTDV